MVQRALVPDWAGPFGACQGRESETAHSQEEKALSIELARSYFEAWLVDPSGLSLWRRERTTSLRP
jgi:hypothetical protein